MGDLDFDRQFWPSVIAMTRADCGSEDGIAIFDEHFNVTKIKIQEALSEQAGTRNPGYKWLEGREHIARMLTRPRMTSSI